jgi:hypothetical protein
MQTRDAIEEVRALHNHICILYDMELVRVIGFREDELDYYYHVRNMDGREWFGTFVGGCVSLKDSYPGYEVLDANWARNHCPPSEEFLVSKATDEENAAMYGENGSFFSSMNAE